MNPWDADVPLTPEAVAGRLAERFPSLAPVNAKYLSEGWDSTVWRVNGEWLFRFVKRADDAGYVRAEVDLLAFLAPRVPFSVPQPAFVAESFFGYRPIVGASLSEVPRDRVDQAALARDLGEFLSVLHACEPPGVRRVDRDGETLRARARASVAKLQGRIELPAKVRERLEGPVPPPSDGAPRLVHNDLLAEHIIVGASGLVGVIDWTDAGLGDAATDFAGFVHWGGRGFAEAVLEHYRGEVDRDFLERATWTAFCVGLFDVDYGLATGRHEYSTEGLEVLRRVTSEP
jgi:aminoglycoside 2''-phosphotransferase